MCKEAGFHNDGSRTATGETQTNNNKRHLVVDHIIPHRGDRKLFHDPDNLQTLCPDHHYIDKQQIERNGYRNIIGNDGWPIDPNHPVNRKSE